MTYSRIQIYLNTGLLTEFSVKEDKDLSLFSYNYSPNLWRGDLKNDISENRIFFSDNGNLEIYKVFCITPVSSIKFIGQETKEFTFDTPTTNNPKIFTLTRTTVDEFGELTYHILDAESHLEHNNQIPYLMDRNYYLKDTELLGDIAEKLNNVFLCRNFDIICLGERYE